MSADINSVLLLMWFKHFWIQVNWKAEPVLLLWWAKLAKMGLDMLNLSLYSSLMCCRHYTEHWLLHELYSKVHRVSMVYSVITFSVCKITAVLCPLHRLFTSLWMSQSANHSQDCQLNLVFYFHPIFITLRQTSKDTECGPHPMQVHTHHTWGKQMCKP